MKLTIEQLKRVIRESLEDNYVDYSNGGKKAYELEPGDVFSTDEGVTWMRCRFIVDDRDPSSSDVIITTTEDHQFHIDSYTHVLLPVSPRELAASEHLP